MKSDVFNHKKIQIFVNRATDYYEINSKRWAKISRIQQL